MAITVILSINLIIIERPQGSPRAAKSDKRQMMIARLQTHGNTAQIGNSPIELSQILRDGVIDLAK